MSTLPEQVEIPRQRGRGDTEESKRLHRRGVRLEQLTTGANLVEAVGGILAGVAAASIALTGFGAGAVVEVLASLIVLWTMNRQGRNEEKALRLLAGAFVVVGTLTVLAALHSVLSGSRAEESLVGTLILTGTVTTMLVLGYAKGRTGRALGHAPLIANAKMTLLDGMLGVAVLLGLVLNLTLSWWWADPVLATLVASLLIREGLELHRGEHSHDTEGERTHEVAPEPHLPCVTAVALTQR